MDPAPRRTPCTSYKPETRSTEFREGRAHPTSPSTSPKRDRVNSGAERGTRAERGTGIFFGIPKKQPVPDSPRRVNSSISREPRARATSRNSGHGRPARAIFAENRCRRGFFVQSEVPDPISYVDPRRGVRMQGRSFAVKQSPRYSSLAASRIDRGPSSRGRSERTRACRQGIDRRSEQLR